MFKVFKTPEFKKAVNFYKDGIKENRKSFVISMGSAVVWCFLIVIIIAYIPFDFWLEF